MGHIISERKMGERRVWLQCTAEFPAEARDILIGQLAHEDIAVTRAAGDYRGPGVLLFEKPCADVHNFLHEVKRQRGSQTLAVAASASTIAGENSWALLRAGARDILAWDSCAEPANSIVSRLQRWLEIDTSLNTPIVRARLRGQSPALRRVLYAATEVARFRRSAVLVTGETGTGKELLARMIHDLGENSEACPFVVCDCTTIVPELSGSEFFGHERGAFTGAVRARDGAFAEADGGTLFLDEVGELPLRLQAELLRVIQEGTYKRVGSNQWLHTCFRLICATHRDLEADIAGGRFREDLYYRIAGCVLRMPSLAERREDIPHLAQAFIEELMEEGVTPVLDASVRDYLLQRSYPGNVRELRQLLLHVGQRYVPPGPITLGCLPEAEVNAAIEHMPTWPDNAWEQAIRTALARGNGIAELRSAVADTAYRIVLIEENGDTARSAHRLRVSQRAVQQYLQAAGA
ncbi:sigma-54-dependent transcriptional regulator [Microbulbifer yueqingensis]|uniref:Sigma-54 interaction domain-containing protein n=1 Tax=Microbulbifer yueqingensis TaxID=658219 RepID=A0A1G9EIR6_9GAMM|nr:sigma 54-interacting transcriptional regulator [Microbulbifer yueqingensis]SDK75999.1 Sigma-54 interaction domain-containing protein [Microbulbifer yueqingensis]